MAIKAYDDPHDAITDAKLAFCPRCWESDEQTVKVSHPFETPEGQLLRSLIHTCRYCGDETETHYVGRIDGVIYSGTWHD